MGSGSTSGSVSFPDLIQVKRGQFTTHALDRLLAIALERLAPDSELLVVVGVTLKTEMANDGKCSWWAEVHVRRELSKAKVVVAEFVDSTYRDDSRTRRPFRHELDRNAFPLRDTDLDWYALAFDRECK